MEKLSKLSRISLRRVLFVSMLIIGLSIFSTMRANATTVSYDPPTYSAITPHDSITITSDSDFTVFPGSGTEEDPYLIEGHNITTTSDVGIYITDTTKYFIVCNCYVDAEEDGIHTFNIDFGTATIINNTCENNNNRGIYLFFSGSSTVINNTCNNNKQGISLSSSILSNVVNNTCNNNNICGISLWSSDYSTISNNTCNNNDYHGISLSSSNCEVTYNLLQENEYYGVDIYPGSDNNLIYHNTFVDNNLGGTSQAFDYGANNYWYDSETSKGNYWSDWSGTGSYMIQGFITDVYDLYPLDEPAEYSTVETQVSFTFTLLIIAVPLLLTKLLSRRRRKTA